MSQSVLETLTKHMQRFQDITIPPYINKRHLSTPSEQELDYKAMLPAINKDVSEIQKPVFAVMGAYNSGKTFLIRYLTGVELLSSNIQPETSSVTVLRHINDRPANWHQDRQVFVLRPGADPRTLAFDAVAESGTYDDLKRFTTYSGGHEYSIVVVFLDSPALDDKVIIDCPGVGGIAEAEHEVSTELHNAHKRTVRERELQRTAMACADGFVVLSSLVGGGGTFSDSNTAQVLGELASHAGRFPTKSPHANVLLVGSQADPNRTDLRNEREVLAVVKSAVLKQIEALPREMQEKLEAAALMNRVVLFYALDPHEIQQAEGAILRTLSRSHPSAPIEDLKLEAKKQFDEDRSERERILALDAAFRTMTDQLKLQMELFRAQVSTGRIANSLNFFRAKAQKYIQQAYGQAEVEELSRKYSAEKDARDQAWDELNSRIPGHISKARSEAFNEFQLIYANFENKKNVEALLKETFISKEQAREHAPTYIQDKIQERFEKGLNESVSKLENAVVAELASFDTTYLARKAKKDDMHLDATKVGDIAIGTVPTASAKDTFIAVAAGLVGGTTLAALGGSVIANAVMAKLLLAGVGVMGAVGLKSAALGLLVGIPVAGWVLLGIAGIVTALWYLFRSWESGMADVIVKSFQANRSTSEMQARSIIGTYFEATESVLTESLRKTKNSIDGHIAETHEIAEGTVTSNDLRSAARFYEEHIELLTQAREEIGLK